jgi:hypothetical protein
LLYLPDEFSEYLLNSFHCYGLKSQVWVFLSVSILSAVFFLSFPGPFFLNIYVHTIACNAAGMVIICVHRFFWLVEICAIFGGKKYGTVVVVVFVVVHVFLLYLPLCYTKSLDSAWKYLYNSSFLPFSLIVKQILNAYMQKFQVRKMVNNVQYILA